MIEARKKAVEYFFVQKYGSPPVLKFAEGWIVMVLQICSEVSFFIQVLCVTTTTLILENSRQERRRRYGQQCLVAGK
jgi:hypothetical protein